MYKYIFPCWSSVSLFILAANSWTALCACAYFILKDDQKHASVTEEQIIKEETDEEGYPGSQLFSL